MTTGQVFSFDMLKDRRKYTTSDGTKVDGVTDVLRVLDKPALLYWAHKLGAQGISLDEARRGAANIGTVAHARIEAWVRDMVFDEDSVDPKLVAASDQAVQKFKGWWTDLGFTLEHAEYALVSDDLRIGGRMDIIARRNGKRALVDVKTSSGIYAEMRLQMGGYVELAAAKHRAEIHGKWDWHEPVLFDEVWIARVGKDEPGDVDAVEIPNSEVEQLRAAFRGLAVNHYNLKRILSRR